MITIPRPPLELPGVSVVAVSLPAAVAAARAAGVAGDSPVADLLSGAATSATPDADREVAADATLEAAARLWADASAAVVVEEQLEDQAHVTTYVRTATEAGYVCVGPDGLVHYSVPAPLGDLVRGIAVRLRSAVPETELHETSLAKAAALPGFAAAAATHHGYQLRGLAGDGTVLSRSLFVGEPGAVWFYEPAEQAATVRLGQLGLRDLYGLVWTTVAGGVGDLPWLLAAAQWQGEAADLTAEEASAVAR